MSRRVRQRRRDRGKGHPARRIAAALVVAAVAAVGAVAAYAATWVLGVLNDTPDIATYAPQPQGAISTIYASDGTRLGFISSDILRTAVGGRKIPEVVKQATVAIEDRRFFEHGGVDYVGVARAAVKNVTSDSAAQGGSTLTMQLVRNLYTPEDRFSKTLERKVREAKLANELEDEHSKQWILDAYLNNVPYGTVGGQTAVGIEAASRIFFDKPATRLTLSEAALLAGLPQAPSADNPFEHPKRALRRRGEVLKAMVTAKAITQAEADRAADTPLGVVSNTYYQQRKESFFFDYVKQELIKRYGAATVQAGGLKVYTTIDLDLQEKARTAIADHLNQPDQPSAALVTIDPDNGHILAMASSATYGKTVFNYATQAFRQPGSTFKAIDLMAAVREGASPTETYYNSHELKAGWDSAAPTWAVATDDHRYSGSISLQEAMAKSDNTVYAQLGQDLTPEKVRQAAYDMGVTSHLDAYPAESIGGLTKGVSPLEMANAYATIANGGVRHRATALERVELADGTVEHPGRGRGTRKFTDGETSVVTTALKTVLDHGTAAGLGIGCPNAGKTGTTSSFTDAWFVGYTPKLSTAVWVGYPKETTSMTAVPGYGEVFGATIPGPIWSQYMKAAKGSFCGDFPEPKTPFEGKKYEGKYANAAREPDPEAPETDPNDPNATGGATPTGPDGTTTPGATTTPSTGAGTTAPAQTQTPAPAQTPTPTPAPATGTGGDAGGAPNPDGYASPGAGGATP